MTALLVVGFFLILIVIVLFAFPRFSPIPYFPTNKKDLPLILKALNLKNSQTVVDFGAGDGEVIFAAAEESLSKNFDTLFVAVDINPILILIMLARRIIHPNKKNIQIVYGDMFKLDAGSLSKKKTETVFYLYISPWLLEKTVKIIRKSHDKSRLVSYFYPVLSLKDIEKKIDGNIHPIYSYNAV